MSDFDKTFLLEAALRLGNGTPRQIFLAAFGKHPGWDDHVEDLGLETEGLILAKSLLYVQGIGKQIDLGAWEKLEPAEQLPAFKHLFLWQRGGQFLLGRMWSSSDGKGRPRHPMIVCAHCTGVPLHWAVQTVLPRLEELEHACLLTNSAAEVRKALDESRAALRTALAAYNTDTDWMSSISTALGRFVDRAELGPLREGLFRILYQIESQMSAFARRQSAAKADAGGLRPREIRVPVCGETPGGALLLWVRFFLSQLDASVPLLLALPLEEGWLDVIVGEATHEELFCLRASARKLPLASDVPCSLTVEFKEQAARTLEAFVEQRAAPDAGDNGAEVPASSLRRMFSALWGGSRG